MSSSSESIETDRDSHATVESLPEVRARGHGKCVHEYIINIFREIMVAEDWISRARLQDRLNSLLSLDGRTFFDYHASALFSDLKIHTSLDLSGIEFWPGMGCIEQDFWASESGKSYFVISCYICNASACMTTMAGTFFSLNASR